MKKEWMFAGLSAVAAILIAVVPRFLVCSHCMVMGMGCIMAANVQFAMGILIVLMIALTIFMRSNAMKAGMSMSLIFFGILSGLVSTVLIGFCNRGCASAECQCNPYTTLIMVVLSALQVMGGIMQSLYYVDQD